MLKRKFIYFCIRLPRLLLELPGAFFDAVAPHMWPSSMRETIRILDPNSETRERFVGIVGEVLRTIAENDPLRFKRIQREIRTIVNMPVLTGAEYSRLFRVCSIDLRIFPFEESPQTAYALLACALIHESTHGSLFTRRIVQNKRNYSRIEVICNKEMARFALKANIAEKPWELWNQLERAPLSKRLKFLKSEIKNLWTD